MGMPADNHAKSRSFGLQIQFVQVVENIDRDPADFEHIRGGIFLAQASRSTFPRIAVTGAISASLFRIARIADVASMNDVVGTAQRGKGLRAKQAWYRR